MPSFSRQFVGKLNQPDADSITGLSPVIAIGQKTVGMHARSTVGTVSDLYDHLRLLFARKGETSRSIKLSRSLFSFNTELGRCPHCSGIGKEEQIDLEKLVVHPEKTIREGALAPTLPTGYIMYSQVTIDVLNQVCEAEGFNVEIPWNELTEDQQNVILYGSDKIKVPFGKHSLESRLKWTGIKAKPREEGYYKGMIPIMSDILRRDRNANILKYVKSITCTECKGERINADARSVRVKGQRISDLTKLELNALNRWIDKQEWDVVSKKIMDKIREQVVILTDLGLGHLSLDREAKSLSSSEIQRLRVANQLTSSLSDVLYIFDEPSIGLHQEENERMIHHLKELVHKGNTVIVVEHDLATIRQADWIVDVGPQAGSKGGEVLFNGSLGDFLQEEDVKVTSATYRAIHEQDLPKPVSKSNKSTGSIDLIACSKNNLKNIDVSFQLGKLNVVSGKSGTGKTSLVKDTLMKSIEELLSKGELRLRSAPDAKSNFEKATIRELNKPLQSNKECKRQFHSTETQINKLIYVDQSPIGKTPRSNPATYLGISDHIRDAFAKLPLSKERSYTKSRFSFNNKGGRCETCQGAGKIQIGMHFLGNVDLACGECNGKRFNPPTLEVLYKGKSIADIYEMSISEAVAFFDDQPKILRGIETLKAIGLGYLTLGQSSTTLSGGEAQRIKIANQLQKKDAGNTLYVLTEPSTGLHHQDIKTLLELFRHITDKGNTIVCIEQDEQIIQQSDWHIELGPESGIRGGEIMHQGSPKPQRSTPPNFTQKQNRKQSEIVLKGVQTHKLKNIDVRIPKNRITAVTGLSGSGKSSLVYDTIFAESNARFTESLSAYNRSLIHQNNEAKIMESEGLGPCIAMRRKVGSKTTRSTVGTLSGMYDSLRLLYARIGAQNGWNYSAQSFSFNHHNGACESCGGLGFQLKCDPDSVLVNPEKSIFDGAISTNKAVHYYADEHGQFMATLRTLEAHKKWDLSLPWKALTEEQQSIILFGGDDTEWNVEWTFKTKSRTGTQELEAQWLGLCTYLDDEYQRRLSNKNKQVLEAVLHEVECSTCKGSRLKKELLEVQFLGLNIHELTQLSIAKCADFLSKSETKLPFAELKIAEAIVPDILRKIKPMLDLGLGHLSIDRSTKSLSGGEHQRISLAGQFSADLYGVTYVLDEPTIGLDAQQVDALTSLLKNLTEKGNTVIAVEHDAQFIQSAGYIVEMGPGSGNEGGEVVFQGTKQELQNHSETLTAQLLENSGAVKPITFNHEKQAFGVKGATRNNLKNLDVTFQSGQITAVTGVSGSGKSSLIRDVIFESYTKKRSVGCRSIFGIDQFDEVIMIDQKPFTGNRLSTVASFTGILDFIRGEFAKTEEAKQLGFKKADFSYQSKKGKCSSCAGHGQQKTSLDFMGDIWTECDVCYGLRYNDEIQQCKLKGKSIGEVLQMTINEAYDFFDHVRIKQDLQLLKDVGIGHLQLGHGGNILSGGEAQRLKLSKQLMNASGKSLYLFDEPSTGLHQQDLLQLIRFFQRLVEQGNTVLYIEHNRLLISAANDAIKLGPGSGEMGGELV
ncbi:MAG: ATP-binding cassette domain-containing protein [Crocinitomicaceae bacterium]